jgi:mono/diheme cytochrome c family protein
MMRGFSIGLTLSLVATTPALLAITPAWGDIGDSKAGRAFVIDNCRSCHDVGNGPPIRSTMPGPAFRDVAAMAATTPLSLRVFLTSSHPPMPNIILTKKEIDDVSAYILSLRPPHRESM